MLMQIKDLSFRRNNRLIFNKINCDIPKGKIIAVMGPSGSGKTTLLELCSRQLKPNSGEIYFKNKNIKHISRKELYSMRRQMGIQFQGGALLSDLTLAQNVAFPIQQQTNLPPEIINYIVAMKLEAVGLRGAGDLMPSELSGGMTIRAALARAIALDPELLFCDEPFSGQDPISTGMIAYLIQTLNQVLGLTIIIVSHHITETFKIADLVYLLIDGKIAASGSPESIKKSTDPAVQQFIHGSSTGPIAFHYPAKRSMIESILSIL